MYSVLRDLLTNLDGCMSNMATMTDPKESISSKSLSPPSYLDDEDDQAMDSIVVESGPLTPLPPPDGLSPPPQGQEDTCMRSPTDEDGLSDEEGADDNEVDDEDDESELLLDIPDVTTDYIIPIKPDDEQDHDSTRDLSENSVSMNDVATKSDLEKV